MTTTTSTSTSTKLAGEIDRIRDEIAGETVISMTNVRNALLDVRLASESGQAVKKIDELLANIPGSGMVKAQWLRDELLLLELYA